MMKSHSYCVFVILTLLAGVLNAAAQVANLGIAPVSDGQFLLYWPADGTTSNVLQTKASLTATNWVTASNAVAVNAVTVTNKAPQGYFRVLEYTNSPGMALIPGGTFTMGNLLTSNVFMPLRSDSDISNARPANVSVSAFFMDVNLVDADQWEAVYTYAQGRGYVFANAGMAQANTTPIQTVDWYDCAAWCNARSVQAGLVPCYYKNSAMTEVYSNATGKTIYQNINNSGFRLPTEAEWEWAARGGLAGNRFPWGDFSSGDRANYDSEPIPELNYDWGPEYFNQVFYDGIDGTSPGGTFPPNGFGLYDMAGNVEQWCWDVYSGTPYPSGSPYLGGTNPTGPATGPNRVLRGGAWDENATLLRCANRDYLGPNMAYDDCGFRCVRGY